MAYVTATSYSKGSVLDQFGEKKGSVVAINVSSYADAPFNTLSPFSFSNEYEIPVPGTNLFSHSVENIWQGLKIINGETNELSFKREPKKRKGIPTGHKLQDEAVDIFEARKKIYAPAYRFYLDNYADPKAIEAIIKQEREGKKVFLYDVEENADFTNPEPLAHAVFLAQYINLKIYSSPKIPVNEEEAKLVQILESVDLLDNKVKAIKEEMKDPKMQKAVEYFCRDHPETITEVDVWELISKERELK